MFFVIDNADAVIPPTGNKTAIVTIVIGGPYVATWDRLSNESWQHYAIRWDMDLIAITVPLDASERAAARSPAWQKLLILNQPWAQQYERIVWLDSDIIISRFAPSIIEYAGPPEKVSLTVSSDRMSLSERTIFLERLYNGRIKPSAEESMWSEETDKNYNLHHVPPQPYMFNTGVMVLSPRHHNELFLSCYEGEQAGRLYEQPLLSYEIITRDLEHRISARFNWGIQEPLLLYLPEALTTSSGSEMSEDLRRQLRFFVRRELYNGYFLHFYGSMGLMTSLSRDDVFGGDMYGNP